MRSFAADRRVRSGRRARSGQVRSGSLSTAVGSPQGRPDRTLALEAQRPNRPARLRSPRKPPSQVTRPQGRGRTATFHGRSHAPRLRRATPARPRAKSYIGRRPRGRLPRHQRLGLRFARKAALASTRSGGAADLTACAWRRAHPSGRWSRSAGPSCAATGRGRSSGRPARSCSASAVLTVPSVLRLLPLGSCRTAGGAGRAPSSHGRPRLPSVPCGTDDCPTARCRPPT